MSNQDTSVSSTVEQDPEETPWQRLASADPIWIRDPLAEVLGMVPEGEPLVVTFADVAKAAGHACPAVAGAYRSTQIGLDRLYPNTHPVRSKITVTVGGEPDHAGLGPMANVIRHITGAADETGFTGFGGFGGREDLLSFDEIAAPGRAFRYERTDTDASIVVAFDPTAAGVDPEASGGSPMDTLPKIISGNADQEETAAFRDQWHSRVQRILDAPAEDGPFTIKEVK